MANARIQIGIAHLGVVVGFVAQLIYVTMYISSISHKADLALYRIERLEDEISKIQDRFKTTILEGDNPINPDLSVVMEKTEETMNVWKSIEMAIREDQRLEVSHRLRCDSSRYPDPQVLAGYASRGASGGASARW